MSRCYFKHFKYLHITFLTKCKISPYKVIFSIFMPPGWTTGKKIMSLIDKSVGNGSRRKHLTMASGCVFKWFPKCNLGKHLLEKQLCQSTYSASHISLFLNHPISSNVTGKFFLPIVTFVSKTVSPIPDITLLGKDNISLLN